MNRIFLWVFPALVSISAACVGAVDPSVDDESMDDVELPAYGNSNGMTRGDLGSARILVQSAYRSALLNGSLPLDYPANIVREAVCGDFEGSRDVMRYIVRCALDEGTNVDFDCTPYNMADVSFSGATNLAGGWRTGSCSTVACQQRVSACLIAYTSVSGASIDIHLFGDYVPQDHRGTMRAEGTYWGNVFADQNAQQKYGCKSSDLITRVCGDNPAECSWFSFASPTLQSCNARCGSQVWLPAPNSSTYYWKSCAAAGKSWAETVSVWR